MKITDLIEAPIQTNVEDKHTHRKLYDFQQSVKHKDHGNFSVVKPDRSDPHMVRKSARRSRHHSYKDEGFKVFITYLLKNKIENIHMPRVYDVTTIKGSDGYEVDTYRLEKLIPANVIPERELTAYAQRMMGVEDADFYYLADKIASVIDGKAEFRFTEDSLNDACEIIKDVIRHTGGLNDLAPFNFMFRRTPHGLQIVLNDPIYVHTHEFKPVSRPKKNFGEEDEQLLRDLGV